MYVEVGEEPIQIPWERVFEEMDEERSVAMAEDKTWRTVVERVVRILDSEN